MWLEAIITKEDLTEIVRDVLPARIDLGESDRWLHLEAATDLALVPDRGLRVTCSGELGWSFIGISSPTVKLDELTVILVPQVIERNGEHLLEFQLEVEEADVRGPPSLVDGAIRRAVNAALAAKHLSWNFSERLSQTLGLAPMAPPVDAVKIDVLWGKQRITAEALALVVSFKVHFLREA